MEIPLTQQNSPASRCTFALVDCNNFYVSCERVFNPKLRDKPVIVLSNNDGVAVARSQEAKELGIPMGAPEFKIRHLIKQHDIAVLSSNYTLYADMSKRVMNILSSCSQQIEIYSIDEAFLSLDHNLYTNPADLSKYAAHMRDTVMKWTGIPVSIGIGPTKTLAKLANAVAKKDPDAHGVCNFINNPHTDEFMKSIPVVKIWGVGRRNAVKLNLHGIYTVYDFARASENWLRENLTITGYRTHQELNGISCINLIDVTPPRKTIISSRSFREPVTTLQPLREAIASYVSIAARKLRKQQSTAAVILVFITTKHYGNGPHYSQSTVQALHPASSYTPLLIKTALKLLSDIYKPGYRYKKAGVVLSGIHSTKSSQMDLFCPGEPHEETVMNAIDTINTQWGNGTIKTASEGLKKEWSMKREFVSPRYTTDLREILSIG